MSKVSSRGSTSISPGVGKPHLPPCDFQGSFLRFIFPGHDLWNLKVLQCYHGNEIITRNQFLVIYFKITLNTMHLIRVECVSVDGCSLYRPPKKKRYGMKGLCTPPCDGCYGPEIQILR